MRKLGGGMSRKNPLKIQKPSDYKMSDYSEIVIETSNNEDDKQSQYRGDTGSNSYSRYYDCEERDQHGMPVDGSDHEYDDMPELEDDDVEYRYTGLQPAQINVDAFYYLQPHVYRAHFLTTSLIDQPTFVKPILQNGWLIGVHDADGNAINIKNNTRMMLGRFSIYDDDDVLMGFLGGDLILGLNGGAQGKRGKDSNKERRRREHRRERRDRKSGLAHNEEADEVKVERPKFHKHRDDCDPQPTWSQKLVLNNWQEIMESAHNVRRAHAPCHGEFCHHRLGAIVCGNIDVTPVSVTGCVMDSSGRPNHIECSKFDRTVVYWLSRNEFTKAQFESLSICNKRILSHFGLADVHATDHYFYDVVNTTSKKLPTVHLIGIPINLNVKNNYKDACREAYHNLNLAIDEMELKGEEIAFNFPPLSKIAALQEEQFNYFVHTFSKDGLLHDQFEYKTLHCYSTAAFNKHTGMELPVLPSRDEVVDDGPPPKPAPKGVDAYMFGKKADAPVVLSNNFQQPILKPVEDVVKPKPPVMHPVSIMFQNVAVPVVAKAQQQPNQPAPAQPAQAVVQNPAPAVQQPVANAQPAQAPAQPAQQPAAVAPVQPVPAQPVQPVVAPAQPAQPAVVAPAQPVQPQPAAQPAAPAQPAQPQPAAQAAAQVAPAQPAQPQPAAQAVAQVAPAHINVPVVNLIPPPLDSAPSGYVYKFIVNPHGLQNNVPAVSLFMLENFVNNAQRNITWWVGENSQAIYIVYRGMWGREPFLYTGWARPLFIHEVVTAQNATNDGLLSFHQPCDRGFTLWPDDNKMYLTINRPWDCNAPPELLSIWNGLGYGDSVTISVWGSPQKRLNSLAISLYWSALNGSKHFDVTLLAAKIQAEYKRRYGATEWLDQELMQILRGDPVKSCLYYSAVIQNAQNEEKLWTIKAEAVITNTAANDGTTTKRVRENAMMGWVKTLASGFSLPAAATTLFNHGKYVMNMIREPDREIQRQMLANVNPTNKFTIKPLNKAALRKLPGSELLKPLPPIWDEVKFDFDEQLATIKTDQRVDSFGTITNAPIAYMNGDDECVALALRHRHAFTRDVDEQAEKELFEFGVEVMREMFDNITLNNNDAHKFLLHTYGTKRGERLWKLCNEPLTMRDLRIEYFMKLEAYLGKTENDAKPRPISNRSDKLPAHFGVDFSDLGKQLANFYFNRDGNVFYATKCTPDDVGAFGQEIDNEMSFIYEADASSWDGSLPPVMARLEEHFLRNYTSGWQQDIDFLLDNWGHNFGTSKSKAVKYSCDHGRNSGDLWTSSLNSLLNVIITMWVNDLKWCDSFKMLVLGDDNVVGLSKPFDAEHIIAQYARLGMTLELVPRESILDATFCSGRFWMVNGRIRWGSNPFRILSKLGLNHHNHKPVVWKGLLYGMAKSMLPIAGHIPVVGALFRRISQLSAEAGIKPRRSKADVNPYRIQGGVVIWPGNDTYAQFCRIYDCDLATVMAVEQAFSTLTLDDFPLYLTGPFFDHGVSVDIGVECEVTPFEIDDCSVEYFEEVDKLNSPYPLVKAFQHGMDEVELGGNWFAPLAHMLLTIISSMSLTTGVMLHQQFNNHLAIPLNKQKLKSKPKKKQVKKQQKKVKKVVRKSLPRIAAEELAGMVGHHLMGRKDLGKAAMSQALNYFGVGDFSPRTNSLVRTGIPTVNSYQKSQNHLTVKNTERIAEIEGSTTSVFHYWRINPLNSSLFPVLASEAVRWEQYRFHGLMFYYGPQSGMVVNGTNPNLGYVAMCDQLDVADEVFDSVTKVMNYGNTGWARTDKELIIGVECKSKDRPYEWYFCDDLNTDDRTTDWGRFTFMAADQPGTNPIGQLFVTYDIEFKGRKYMDVPRYIEYNMYSRTGISAVEPLGDDDDRHVEANIGIFITDSGSGSGDTFNFPSDLEEGYFRIRYYVEGDTPVADPTVTFHATNGTWLPTWFAPDRTGSLSTHGASGFETTSLYHESVFRIDDFDAAIRLTSLVIPGDADFVSVSITQVFPPADYDTEISPEIMLKRNHVVSFKNKEHKRRTYGRVATAPIVTYADYESKHDDVCYDDFHPVESKNEDDVADYKEYLLDRLQSTTDDREREDLIDALRRL